MKTISYPKIVKHTMITRVGLNLIELTYGYLKVGEIRMPRNLNCILKQTPISIIKMGICLFVV